MWRAVWVDQRGARVSREWRKSSGHTTHSSGAHRASSRNRILTSHDPPPNRPHTPAPPTPSPTRALHPLNATAPDSPHLAPSPVAAAASPPSLPPACRGCSLAAACTFLPLLRLCRRRLDASSSLRLCRSVGRHLILSIVAAAGPRAQLRLARTRARRPSSRLLLDLIQARHQARRRLEELLVCLLVRLSRCRVLAVGRLGIAIVRMDHAALAIVVGRRGCLLRRREYLGREAGSCDAWAVAVAAPRVPLTVLEEEAESLRLRWSDGIESLRSARSSRANAVARAGRDGRQRPCARCCRRYRHSHPPTRWLEGTRDGRRGDGRLSRLCWRRRWRRCVAFAAAAWRLSLCSCRRAACSRRHQAIARRR